MRYVIAIIAIACTAQAAEPDDSSVADCPAPVITFPKRVITVTPDVFIDGVRSPGTCNVNNGDGSVDYNGCCPDGWHVLALSVDGVICEEN